MDSEELGTLLFMWQAQLIEKWGVNSNFTLFLTTS